MSTIAMNIHDSLKEYFGFDSFKGNQEAVINNVLGGIDSFVIMPTGGGKSLCYQLPALMSPGTCIVVSPLIALMKDQVDALRGYNKDDSIAHFLNSSLNKGQVTQVKKDITDGKTKLLYIAPETLTKDENIDFFKSIQVSFVAVDEAHCISEWGHDFRPEYRRIKTMIEGIGKKIPIIALTATATPKVQSDIIRNLDMASGEVFISSFNRSNLFYEVRPKLNNEQAQKSIVQLVKGMADKSGIIYVLSRKSTEEVAQTLQMNGVNAKPYHAGLDAKLRNKTQEDFLMDDIQVIVATIAFGMGIDKPDVRFVIHYDIPKSLENYYQETGRAGRDGLEGKCVAFYSYKDIAKLEKFLKDKPLAKRELASQLIEEVIAFSESASCRRKGILQYFGEEYDEKGCNKMCDNCKTPKEKIEVKKEMVQGLNAVLALKEKFTIKPMIDFIAGRKTREMEDFNFVSNKLFGIGTGKEDLFWHTILRQAILHGLLEKEIEEYGILKVTDKGRAFIEKPKSLKIPINNDYSVVDNSTITSASAGSGAAMDEALLVQLKALRKSESKKHQIQPWVIFQDPSLIDMATYYPISVEDMLQISGVSKGKSDRYGKPFLLLIRDYVEANNIERPEEFVIKQKADKSKNKVAIIQGIDRKLPLDDIAAKVDMDVDKLLIEMNNIVDSGTKLNLDYYIEEAYDEEVVADIFDYFDDAESDSVDEALNELAEDDITLEEIQIARIKYMSINAN